MEMRPVKQPLATSVMTWAEIKLEYLTRRIEVINHVFIQVLDAERTW